MTWNIAIAGHNSGDEPESEAHKQTETDVLTRLKGFVSSLPTNAGLRSWHFFGADVADGENYDPVAESVENGNRTAETP